jgi:hypothetical protein
MVVFGRIMNVLLIRNAHRADAYHLDISYHRISANLPDRTRLTQQSVREPSLTVCYVNMLSAKCAVIGGFLEYDPCGMPALWKRAE